MWEKALSRQRVRVNGFLDRGVPVRQEEIQWQQRQRPVI